MKKVSVLTLSLLITSCALVGNTVPIGSVTAPISSNSYRSGEYSGKIRSINQPRNLVAEPAVSSESIPEVKASEVEPVKTTNEMVNDTEKAPENVAKIPSNPMGTYKIGNPYLIEGVSYYPHEDYTYSEIGMASWYGPSFNGGTTANGEVFDETRFTAAHRTLPMPSVVRVTNLENGISLTVKVNDRGPYARDRIIDLSSAAAEVLRIKEKGTARVRVEILPEESRKLKELAMANQNTDIYEPNIAYSSAEIKPAVNEAPKAEPAVAVRPMPSEPVVQPQGQPKVEAKPEVVAPAQVAAPVSEPVKTGGEYFVQVAAYSTYEKAEGLKDKLVNLGTVKIFKSMVNGQTLYKVRLGEFATKEDAVNVQKKVTDSGIKGSRVILKEDGAFKWNVK